MTRPRFLFEKSAGPVGESRDPERAAVMQPFENQNESKARFFWACVHAWLAAIAIVYVLGGVEWFFRAHMLAGNTDFTTFYVSSRLLLKHSPSKLYDLRVQAEVQKEVLGDYEPPEGFLPYIHPPFEAFLFLPLGYLSFSSALLIWLGASVVLILLVPLFLTSQKSDPLRKHRVTLLLGSLSFFPFLACLWRGQDSILVLSLWALAYRAWKQGRDARAGVFLGLSFIKFHLAYLLLVPLLLEKRVRALFGVGISAGTLILTSALWIGVEGTLGYVEALGSMATTLGKMANPQGKMQSWEAQLYLLGLEGVHSITGRIMIAVIGMGLSGLLWKGRWQPNTRDFELRFSAQVLLALLASPHCHIYDLSLVFLPAVFVLRHLLDQADGSSSIRILLAALLLVSPVVWVLTLWVTGFVPIQISVVWMTVCLVAIWQAANSGFTRTAATPINLAAPLGGS
jgi:hypothetical protein